MTNLVLFILIATAAFAGYFVYWMLTTLTHMAIRIQEIHQALLSETFEQVDKNEEKP